MHQIFPKEIINSSIHSHQFKHSKKSKVIYTTILCAIIAVLVALPFVRVDIYSTHRGLIKPDQERLTVTSINSGKAVFVNLKSNQFVNKGDTLISLDNTLINEKLNLLKLQTDNINILIDDLAYLVSDSKIQNRKISSPKYKKEYLLYTQKLQELYTRHKKLNKDYERNKLLFKKGVIAKVEFENVTLDFDLINNSIYQLKQQQMSVWESQLTEYKNKVIELESNTKQLLDNRLEYVIKAPISGNIVTLKPLEKGSMVSAGEVLASISPNTSLLVECFIAPKDIGLIKLNNTVTFQVDAYNYNQWGLATGTVIDIAEDIEIKNNAPVFKVLCQLNEKKLGLKNGFKGQLKKGMTLNAQFKLTERTLFDLLYDKVDDWVNPSQNELVAINN
ncbi:HlyD family secretion protein [Hyunsoonleella pacifica]|uniref:HlyD family efflux transporter periplasmic adaptor subunit n=1 Tax=Hyunsoonleella pacifica TaxID=1080224 RepID=A0A4Q9FJ24_9FLAO|nr:HlyD family efflux transporter periplasmic adaptor subunit [Hyunsoonleella pacifica]TBN13129.1 HlyD family efflux transporter periplasmic adaptor subunit [Hyunsoonleella pacifica]GGD28406.1 HlyD family type I secretion periplasmic adaptor subunit [Hyunsoonleella pacifica]